MKQLFLFTVLILASINSYGQRATSDSPRTITPPNAPFATRHHGDTDPTGAAQADYKSNNYASFGGSITLPDICLQDKTIKGCQDINDDDDSQAPNQE